MNNIHSALHKDTLTMREWLNSLEFVGVHHTVFIEQASSVLPDLIQREEKKRREKLVSAINKVKLIRGLILCQKLMKLS